MSERLLRCWAECCLSLCADPMVGCWNSKNSFLTKRSTEELFPTAVSPNSTSLKFTVFAIAHTRGEKSRREGWEGKEANGGGWAGEPLRGRTVRGAPGLE